MIDCHQNSIGFKQFVFSIVQNCKDVQKMGLNSSRLFSQNEKSATYEVVMLLIFRVDQPGLEPGTSRL